MIEKTFNLLENPWIIVLTEKMKYEKVSLKDIFTNAHKYIRLAGDTPTQDAAILRLLLAIAGTVFYRYETDGTELLLNEENNTEVSDVLERWEEYWNEKQFHEGLIPNYLEKYSERFWLFHPETPFYQIADLQYGSDYRIDCILGNIKESNNEKTKHHFSLASGNNLKSIELDEAARWLIHLMAYAVNVKKNKKAPGTENPVGTGRMGRLGFVMIDGNNLFETIMLNLCPLIDGTDIWGIPKPEWEEPICALQAREIPIPDNFPSAYTIQSRRCMLKRNDEGKVIGIKVLGGDYYTMENETSEQMTLWGCKIDEKTKKKTEYPKTHDPEIHLWREFNSLIVDNTDDYEKPRNPGVIKWLARLIDEGIYNYSDNIAIHEIGICYGDSKKYTWGDCVDDSLSLSAGLIHELGKTWQILIKDEINKCSEVASLINEFSDRICILFFGDDNVKKSAYKNKLTREYYFKIDKDFKQWLASIDPVSKAKEKKQYEWELISYNNARTVAEEFVTSLGDNIYRISNGSQLTSSIDEQSIPGILNNYMIKLSRIYSK